MPGTVQNSRDSEVGKMWPLLLRSSRSCEGSSLRRGEDRRKSGKLSKKEKAEDSKTEPVGFLEDNYFKRGCTTWHHLEDC